MLYEWSVPIGIDILQGIVYVAQKWTQRVPTHNVDPKRTNTYIAEVPACTCAQCAFQA